MRSRFACARMKEEPRGKRSVCFAAVLGYKKAEGPRGKRNVCFAAVSGYKKAKEPRKKRKTAAQENGTNTHRFGKQGSGRFREKMRAVKKRKDALRGEGTVNIEWKKIRLPE